MQPWVRAWQNALYAADGFYRHPVGPAGHFATSCHGPAGSVFAEAVVTMARRHGCERILDIGAGRGELLRHLSAAAEAAGLRLRLGGVDIVHRPAALAPHIEWTTAPGGPLLPDLGALEATLVVANEWLDVVPCPIGEVDAAGVLREVETDAGGRERLGAPAGESQTFGPAELAWSRRWWPAPRPGDRVEVGLPRDQALAELIARVGSGVIVAIDYGHTLSGGRPAGTLTGYRGGYAVAPVPDGRCDLTAHVAMDSLPHDRLLDQRTALRELGVSAPPASHELAQTDPAAYLAALQRRSAVGELTGAPLGDFVWAVTTRAQVPATQ